MRNVQSVLAAAIVVAVAACSSSAQAPRQMAPTEVVATVGSATITLGELDERALQRSAGEFGGARLVQALYLARRAALDELIGTRLINEEAKAQGLDTATLIEQEISSQAPAPTEADITFWYQANPAR